MLCFCLPLSFLFVLLLFLFYFFIFLAYLRPAFVVSGSDSTGPPGASGFSASSPSPSSARRNRRGPPWAVPDLMPMKNGWPGTRSGRRTRRESSTRTSWPQGKNSRAHPTSSSVSRYGPSSSRFLWCDWWSIGWRAATRWRRFSFWRHGDGVVIVVAAAKKEVTE